MLQGAVTVELFDLAISECVVMQTVGLHPAHERLCAVSAIHLCACERLRLNLG